MDQDLELLLEIWQAMKPLIPVKERLAAADAIINIFDDYGMCHNLEHESGLDKELSAAIASHFDVNIEDTDDDQGWN